MIEFAAIAAFISCMALFAYIPWAVRLATLYTLHDLRDRLYAHDAEARETLLYRDVEFLLCLSLNRVRAADLDKVAKIVTAMLPESGPDRRARKNSAPEREPQYAESMAVLGSDADRIVGLVLPLVLVLTLYMILQRPTALLPVLVAVPVLLVFLVAALVRNEVSGPLSRIAGAVEAIAPQGNAGPQPA